MGIIIIMNNIALMQLLRLCSPTLPIGSYAYSQGLETACHNEYVKDKESLTSWIKGILTHNIQHLDIPIFSRLYDAHSDNNSEKINYWNQYILASRESSELLLEDSQMGGALIKLLFNLDTNNSSQWIDKECSLLTAFSLACVQWNIKKPIATQGLIWAWCENQVSIGIKLIPLGQTSGQLILSELMPPIESAALHGIKLDDDEIGASSLGAVLASMQHENQYTRLFRS